MLLNWIQSKIEIEPLQKPFQRHEKCERTIYHLIMRMENNKFDSILDIVEFY